MSTENKPLFSDPPRPLSKSLKRMVPLYEGVTAEWFAEMSKRAEKLEADRAKTRAVVQRLVDALAREEHSCPNNCFGGAIPDRNGEPEPCQWCWTYGYRADALTLAKSELNIEPTQEKP